MSITLEFHNERAITKAMEAYATISERRPSHEDRMPTPKRVEWVKALRSGKYQQQEGFLRVQRDGEDFCRYCCLGVAYELWSGAETPWPSQDRLLDDASTPEDDVWLGVFTSAEGDQSFPNDDTMQEWGISADQARCLAELNDAGLPFSFMAQVIDTYL